MRLKFYLPILLWLSFLCVTAQAAVVSGLYNASVKIQDQSSTQQQQAAKKALAEVLVKVSGNRQLLQDDVIKRYLNRADDLLLSYQFERKDAGLFYNAEFDINKVEGIIRSTGFPLWGKHRPQTLIWLALEDKNTRVRTLISDNATDSFVDIAKQTAKKRGIEINFPILDLADVQQVSVYDVWSSYSQSLVLASERYAPEYVMSARMYYRHQELADQQQQSLNAPMPLEPVVANIWVIEWMLTRQGAFESGEITALIAETAVQNMVETLADALANKYSISGLQDNSADNISLVKIANVHSLTAYVEVLTFLRDLSMVVDVTLIEQQGDTATFKLQLFGARENLDEAFKLDSRLRFPLDSFGQPLRQQPLRWKP
jgi:hypothetical protein